MTHSEKRILFSTSLAKLVLYMNQLGYGVAIDYVKRCDDCKVNSKNSVHPDGLAADLNLYVDGVYITIPEAHVKPHDYWDIMGGAKRIKGDMNHYSFEHNGRR